MSDRMLPFLGIPFELKRPLFDVFKQNVEALSVITDLQCCLFAQTVLHTVQH